LDVPTTRTFFDDGLFDGGGWYSISAELSLSTSPSWTSVRLEYTRVVSLNYIVVVTVNVIIIITIIITVVINIVAII